MIDLPPMENTGLPLNKPRLLVRCIALISLRSNCGRSRRSQYARFGITFALFELAWFMSSAEDEHFTLGFLGGYELGHKHVQAVEETMLVSMCIDKGKRRHA